MSREHNTHRNTCSTCRCSIVSFDGIKWHHTSERPTAPYPGHFATPLRAIMTPSDVAATASAAFHHFGLVGEVI